MALDRFADGSHRALPQGLHGVFAVCPLHGRYACASAGTAVLLLRSQLSRRGAAVQMIIGSLWLYGAARNNAFSPVGLAPFAVHVGNVGPKSTDGNFEETLAFGGFEKDSFLFGQPMAHRSAANTGLGG
jgi:hypothetical protein